MSEAKVTIDMRTYMFLKENSKAFQAIKKDQVYIHFYSSYTMGGQYMEVYSNDERFKLISEEFETIRKKNGELYGKLHEAQEELKELKSKKGFFKRLFS